MNRVVSRDGTSTAYETVGRVVATVMRDPSGSLRRRPHLRDVVGVSEVSEVGDVETA